VKKSDKSTMEHSIFRRFVIAIVDSIKDTEILLLLCLR